MPSPKHYTNSAEKYFGEKANHVFQHAVAFLLNHERAHAVFEHLPVVATQPNNSELKLQLEKEADVFAFNGLVPHGLSDKEKALESWAVLAVVLATFYVYVDPRRALISTTHPSLHHRIGSLVQSLAWEGDEYRYYLPFLCRLVLQDLFPDVLTPRVQFEDAEEALTDALDALDTITVLVDGHDSVKVRLAGIDAPEKAQPFGKVSKKHLSDRVFGRPVTVEWTKKDKYGRVIGRVMTDGEDVCLDQVRSGLAWHYKHYANEQPAGQRTAYAAAEEQARRAKAGLWIQPNPVPPWEFRHPERAGAGK